MLVNSTNHLCHIDTMQSTVSFSCYREPEVAGLGSSLSRRMRKARMRTGLLPFPWGLFSVSPAALSPPPFSILLFPCV